MHKNAFDPLAQHRDWCPWIAVGKENVDPGSVSISDRVSMCNQQGWKAALDLLIPMNKNSDTADGSPAQASHHRAVAFPFCSCTTRELRCNILDVSLFCLS